MNFSDTKNLSKLYESILSEQYYSDTLNRKFWKNGKFDAEIREKLLIISRDFYDSLELEVPILDIQLTGSLANYNYTDFSDLDTHIIIDFSKINKDTELVKKALDGMRFIWNQRHDIIIRGHDVELYLQDINEQHTASGLYSLLNGEWIRKPKHNPPEIDEKDVEVKYLYYVQEILEIENKLKSDLSEEEYANLERRAKRLKEKIQEGRKQCLSGKMASEFCVENLVFKKLRNTGMIEKLINLISVTYDKKFSS